MALQGPAWRRYALDPRSPYPGVSRQRSIKRKNHTKRKEKICAYLKHLEVHEKLRRRLLFLLPLSTFQSASLMSFASLPLFPTSRVRTWPVTTVPCNLQYERSRTRWILALIVESCRSEGRPLLAALAEVGALGEPLGITLQDVLHELRRGQLPGLHESVTTLITVRNGH